MGLSIHIFHRHLRFAVGAQIRQDAFRAHGGEPLGQLVGKLDRQRHKQGCFIAGIAEHHTLIAGTQLLFIVHGIVHTHGNVGRLPVQRAGNGAFISKSVFRFGVTDFTDYLSGTFFIIDLRIGCNFAHDMDGTGFGCDLTGTAAHGILLQQGI